jgi:transglutaminase-like putative cysteine protease
MRYGAELPSRGALSWLLFALLAVFAPLALFLPWWITLSAMGLALVRPRLRAKGWVRRVLRYAVTIGLAVGVFWQYGTLLGRDAGVALLAAMTALKFLEIESRRDAMLTVFLLCFLVLGVGLFTQSLWFAAYAGGALWLLTATLARINDARGDMRGTARLAATMALQALPLAALMFFFFPRVHGALWGVPQEVEGARAGLSEEMRPGSIRELTLSDAIAFRAAFHGEVPAVRERYWRAFVLWQTDGFVWKRGAEGLPRDGGFRPAGPPYAYEITLEPTGDHWLPALDMPTEAPLRALVVDGSSVQSVDPVRDRIRYRLTSQTRYAYTALDPRNRERALALPRNLDQRVRRLAHELRGRGGSDSGTVNEVLRHFNSERFYYTLSPPLMTTDPVAEFLFDARRGFCEHYTSAFVTLMRAAGIPARVVSGYQGGEINPAGGYLIVRNRDAHAWAEVWIEGSGWRRADPTAAIAPERIEYGADALERLLNQGALLGTLSPDELLARLQLDGLTKLRRQLQFGWDAVNAAWFRWVLDYDDRRQRELLWYLGLDRLPWVTVVVGITALAGALLLLYALSMRARAAVDPIAALYARYCRKLARVGIVRQPGEAPLAFANRVVSVRPELADDVQAITAAYAQLRYNRVAPAALHYSLRRRIGHFAPRPTSRYKTRQKSSPADPRW